MALWAVELHAQPAANSIGMGIAKLLRKLHAWMLQQHKPRRLSSETPGMVHKIDEQFLIKRTQQGPLRRCKSGAGGNQQPRTRMAQPASRSQLVPALAALIPDPRARRQALPGMKLEQFTQPLQPIWSDATVLVEQSNYASPRSQGCLYSPVKPTSNSTLIGVANQEASGMTRCHKCSISLVVIHQHQTQARLKQGRQRFSRPKTSKAIKRHHHPVLAGFEAYLRPPHQACVAAIRPMRLPP